MREAMAQARPVVSTFVGGVPELVTPKAGWLVPAGDEDSGAGCHPRLASKAKVTPTIWSIPSPVTS